MGDRWPPIYNAEELRHTIRDLVHSGRIRDGFYEPPGPKEGVCQGDVIRLQASVPVIARDGSPALHEDVDHWLVLGNTCDFARDLSVVEWTQVAPIRATANDVRAVDVRALQRYELSRVFYVPRWSGFEAAQELAADFSRPVALHKGTFYDRRAVVVARLSYVAWILLHSCLVRFLARDDGRFDD